MCKKITYIFTVFSLLFILASCEKDEYSNTGYLRDFTGLDGCYYVIELNNSIILEPVNLDDFNLDLKDGLKVKFSFDYAKEYVSICMTGEMVILESIEIDD